MNISLIDKLNDSNSSDIKELEFQVKLFNGTPGLGALEQMLVVRRQMRVNLINAANGLSPDITGSIEALAKTAGKIESHAISLHESFGSQSRTDIPSRDILSGVVYHAQNLNRDLYALRQELKAPAVEQDAPRPNVSAYSDAMDLETGPPAVDQGHGRESL